MPRFGFLVALVVNSLFGASLAGGAEAAKPPPPPVIFDGLCQALRDNYPMLELVGWEEAWARDFRGRIAAAPDRESAFGLMEELVCRLNDYHTWLSWPGQPRWQAPPIDVEPVLERSGIGPRGIWDVRPPLEMPALDGIAIAVIESPADTEVKAGDEILEVDGVRVREALAKAWRHAVGSSSAGKLKEAAKHMLAGAPGAAAKLQVRRQRAAAPAEVLTVTVPRMRRQPEGPISSYKVDGVPVMRIRRWGDGEGVKLIERFDADLERWRGRPGLIIDVRGNGGGSDGLAEQAMGRFLRAPIIASISFQRRTPGQTFERLVATAHPRGPWPFEGRVAVLTDEGCMSACEHFVSGMIEAGALTCGTPTSGCCGWIRPVDLPGGVKLHVARTYPLHTGGVPSPLLGIPPHLWAPRTLDDVRAGKDTALAVALRWVRSSEPVPLRLQPVAPLVR